MAIKSLKHSFLGASILAVCGVLGYAVIWAKVSLPYRYLPSDDISFSELNNEELHGFFLKIVSFFIWAVASLKGHPETALPVLTIFFNAGTAFLIGILIFRLTESTWFALLGIFLFCCSAWPAVYLFWFTYPPVLGFLCILFVFLVTEASQASEARRTNLLTLLGVISGTQLFIAISSAPVICLQALFLACFLKADTLRKRLKATSPYLMVLALFIAIYILTYGEQLLLGLGENVNNPRFAMALRKFQYHPKPPFLSFIYVGNVYGPELFAFFGGTYFLSLFLAFKRKEFTHLYRVVLWVGIVVFGFVLLIDFLPFTKLGRIYYPVYPLVVLSVVLQTYYLITQLPQWKHVLASLSAGVFLWFAISSIRINLDMIDAKQSGAAALEQLSETHPLYMLRQDPHARYFRYWLRKKPKTLRRVSDFLDQKNHKAALIFGPTGFRSGNSVLQHCTLRDLHFKVKKPADITELKVPYFAYFPLFMMEEEVCQALYFEKKLPDYKASQYFITAWLREKSAD